LYGGLKTQGGTTDKYTNLNKLHNREVRERYQAKLG